MVLEKAAAAGFQMEEAHRCVVPKGKIVICSNGKVTRTQQTPSCEDMDAWTHRYYDTSGIIAAFDDGTVVCLK